MKYLLALLLFASPLWAQKVTLPKEVVADGPLVLVKAETESPTVRWYLADPGISMIPVDLLKDSRTAIIIVGSKQGRFRLFAWVAKGDIASDLAVCVVVVGNVPPVPPDPGPVPGKVTVPNVVGQRYEDAQAAVKAIGLVVAAVGPMGQPVASQSPVGGTLVAVGSTVTLTMGEPPSPAPIPLAGFRVLIVEETAERGKLTVGQRAAILGKEARDYLNAKCVKEGMQAAYWILDKDVDVSGLPKHWIDVWDRQRNGDKDGKGKRTSLPWLIVSNGKDGYEGPLPEKIEDTMAILKKYAEVPGDVRSYVPPAAGSYAIGRRVDSYFARD